MKFYEKFPKTYFEEFGESIIGLNGHRTDIVHYNASLNPQMETVSNFVINNPSKVWISEEQKQKAVNANSLWYLKITDSTKVITVYGFDLEQLIKNI